jgi:hypothetical protein
MVAEQSCQDSEKLHQGIVGTALAKSANRASAGTQGDSLNACIVGIPTDATVGQRMLAEESCKRDQLMHHWAADQRLGSREWVTQRSKNLSWFRDDVSARFLFLFTPFRHSLRHFFQSLSGTAKDAVWRVGTIKVSFAGCDADEQFQRFFDCVGGVREYLWSSVIPTDSNLVHFSTVQC